MPLFIKVHEQKFCANAEVAAEQILDTETADPAPTCIIMVVATGCCSPSSVEISNRSSGSQIEQAVANSDPGAASDCQEPVEIVAMVFIVESVDTVVDIRPVPVNDESEKAASAVPVVAQLKADRKICIDMGSAAAGSHSVVIIAVGDMGQNTQVAPDVKAVEIRTAAIIAAIIVRSRTAVTLVIVIASRSNGTR